jgi:hypothetical protein
MSTLKTTNIAHPSSASNNIVLDSSGNVVLQAGTASAPALQPTSDPNTGIFFPAADTIAFAEGGSEAMRIDSSSRLLVGTSTSVGGEQIQSHSTSSNAIGAGRFSANAFGSEISLYKSRNGTIGSNTVVQSGDNLGNLIWYGADGSGYVIGATIKAEVDGTPGANDMPGRLVLSTTADGASSPTERMRIRAVGTTSIFGPSDTLWVATSESSGTTHALFVGSNAAGGFNGGSVSVKILSNGNIQNTNNSYTAFSDIKLKENIVDAGSQWSDLKALQVRNYNLKEGQTHRQIGLIAQEVEPISPGLVYETPDRDEEGNDLGTVTKSVNYSVLYMKAVKALQEAMERIEALEAKVTALEAQ